MSTEDHIIRIVVVASSAMIIIGGIVALIIFKIGLKGKSLNRPLYLDAVLFTSIIVFSIGIMLSIANGLFIAFT